MLPARCARIGLLPAAVGLLLSATAATAQAPPPSEWKVFQEFGFLTGSWSGTAESGGKIGGRGVTFGLEVEGATLAYRATTYYPAKDGEAELKAEEIARIVYDGSKGKYVALLVFSTKAWGIFDGEVRPDGSIRFTSRELANLEAGVKLRWTLSKKADGTLLEEVEVAGSGKDFAPYLSATLTKR